MFIFKNTLLDFTNLYVITLEFKNENYLLFEFNKVTIQ